MLRTGSHADLCGGGHKRHNSSLPVRKIPWGHGLGEGPKGAGNRPQCTTLSLSKRDRFNLWIKARDEQRDAFGSRGFQNLKGKLRVRKELARPWGKYGRHAVEMCRKARHEPTWM